MSQSNEYLEEQRKNRINAVNDVLKKYEAFLVKEKENEQEESVVYYSNDEVKNDYDGFKRFSLDFKPSSVEEATAVQDAKFIKEQALLERNKEIQNAYQNFMRGHEIDRGPTARELYSELFGKEEANLNYGPAAEKDLPTLEFDKQEIYVSAQSNNIDEKATITIEEEKPIEVFEPQVEIEAPSQEAVSSAISDRDFRIANMNEVLKKYDEYLKANEISVESESYYPQDKEKLDYDAFKQFKAEYKPETVAEANAIQDALTLKEDALEARNKEIQNAYQNFMRGHEIDRGPTAHELYSELFGEEEANLHYGPAAEKDLPKLDVTKDELYNPSVVGSNEEIVHIDTKGKFLNAEEATIYRQEQETREVLLEEQEKVRDKKFSNKVTCLDINADSQAHVAEERTITGNIDVIDRGKSLEAQEGTELSAREMARVASEKGWQSIDVEGNQTFRQEVWREASTRGMDVRGYVPHEEDIKAVQDKMQGRGVDAPEAAKAAEDKGVNSGYGIPEAKESERATALKTMSLSEVIDKYPELTKEVAVIKAAEEQIKSKIEDPEIRAMAMQGVRDNVAMRMDRGERMPDIKITEEVQRKERVREEERTRVQEKDVELTL